MATVFIGGWSKDTGECDYNLSDIVRGICLTYGFDPSERELYMLEACRDATDTVAFQLEVNQHEDGPRVDELIHLAKAYKTVPKELRKKFEEFAKIVFP